MAELTEIEQAWCQWAQRYRGSRSDPSSVVSFAAGAKYGERVACARIRRELLAALANTRHSHRPASGAWLLSEAAALAAMDAIIPPGED